MEDDWALDIELEVELSGSVVSRTNARGLYWTMPQQLAHATVNGASLRTGDLFASGTISGADPGSEGSLIELTRNGAQPIGLDDGSERTFLEDGDEVVLRARAGELDLGEVAARSSRRAADERAPSGQSPARYTWPSSRRPRTVSSHSETCTSSPRSHSGLDTLAFEQVDEVFRRDVAGRVRCERAPAEASDGCVQDRRARLERGERVRVAGVARVVEVPADRDAELSSARHEPSRLARHADADRVGE